MAARAAGRAAPATTPDVGVGVQLVLLSCAAAAMDVLSYLRLGEVFTSAMTGNTVLLGLGIGQGNLAATSRNLCALVSFVVGLAFGGALLRSRTTRRAEQLDLVRAYALETVLLIGFVALWQFGDGPSSDALLYGLIALSALAMGLQSAAAHHIGIPGMATTYFTGTLTNIAAGITKALRHRVAGDAQPAPATRMRTRWQAYAFGGYLVSAALTGLLASPKSPFAAATAATTALPAVALLLVLVIALRRREPA